MKGDDPALRALAQGKQPQRISSLGEVAVLFLVGRFAPAKPGSPTVILFHLKFRGAMHSFAELRGDPGSLPLLALC